QRESAGERGSYRKAVSHEGGGIVDQAFPFQNYDNAVGNFEPLGYSRSRNGVRRGNNRAENKSGREGQIHEVMDEVRHHHGGEKNEANRKKQNGTQVGAEIPPRGEQRRRKQER